MGHRHYHVRWDDGIGEAGGSSRDADTFAVERRDQRIGIDTRESDAGRVWDGSARPLTIKAPTPLGPNIL